MNPESSVTNVDIDENIIAVSGGSPSWGAIFAGTIAGLGVHFLLLMLGTAMGLGAAEPATSENPIAGFGMGTAVVWTLSALIAPWAGGWVAGRYAARGQAVSGRVHGFLVWCVAMVIGLMLVVSGAGALVGGAARVVGEGFSVVGKSVGGAADLAKDALGQNKSALESMVGEVVESQRAKNNGVGVAAAQREVGRAVGKLFREGGDLRNTENRAALVQALTQAGMSESDANQAVERWSASVQRMRADLEETKAAAAAKAREAADKAAKAMAIKPWAFIGFVLGALAASGAAPAVHDGNTGTRLRVPQS